MTDTSPPKEQVDDEYCDDRDEIDDFDYDPDDHIDFECRFCGAELNLYELEIMWCFTCESFDPY